MTTSKNTFQPGDVVQAASGGPHMTVEGCSHDRIALVWFDNEKHLNRSAVQAEVLHKV